MAPELAQTSRLGFWVLGHLKGWSYAPTVPTLCAACVPTQPNWAELRHAQRDNDGEKLVTQRASAALSEPEWHSKENRLASFVISRSPVRLRRVAVLGYLKTPSAASLPR